MEPVAESREKAESKQKAEPNEAGRVEGGRAGGEAREAVPQGSSEPEPSVGRKYFEAVAARDLDGDGELLGAGRLERIAPVGDLRGPDEVREFFSGLCSPPSPTSTFEVLDLVAARNQVAVRWRRTGTFCGGPFQGIEPTGARIELEGIDLLTIEDGMIQRNDAYYDSAQFARAVGLLPPQDSATERAWPRAFNARTRLLRPLFAPSVEQVAEGVWLVRGGFPHQDR